MTSPHVLLVDGSLSVRVNLQHALMASGFRVTACESGAAARKAMQRHLFSMIITEAELPDVDGLNFVRTMRASSLGARIPVCIISSECGVSARLRGLNAGAADYIGKPLGSAFVVKRARHLTEMPPSSAPTSAFGSHNPARILIIDDSETFLNAFADRLRAEGHDVILAKSGEEALAFLDAQAVDGIVLDLFMPGLSGLETCRRIRNLPAASNVPMMLLTGREDAVARATGLSAGVDDYMVKSTDLTAMAVRLGDLLRRKTSDLRAARAARGPDSPRSSARLGTLLAMAASSAGAPSESKPRLEARPSDVPSSRESSPSLPPRDSSPTLPSREFVPTIMPRDLAPGLVPRDLAPMSARDSSPTMPPPSSQDSNRTSDVPSSGQYTSPLFEQVLNVSGLQHLIGRGCLRRAFDRAGVDSRSLTVEGLEKAMPEIRQTLSVFLSKEEADRHGQAISVLLKRASTTVPAARGSA